MKYDPLFDTVENKTLLAICARKLIKNIGVGGVIWGLINIGFGLTALDVADINIGLVILGGLMLLVGFQALKKPSLGVLLAETIVALLLFIWNLGIFIYNTKVGADVAPRGLIFPIIIAITFFRQYLKLGHVRDQIATLDPGQVKRMKQMCKMLLKKKLKDEPAIVQTTFPPSRAELLDDKAFFIQKNLMRAFVCSKEDLRNALAKPEAKSLLVNFAHPLGPLKYQFDKKNSDKLNNWLAVDTTLAEPYPDQAIETY